jgi:NAD(P)-dependent dehydrogenase (short-subunit alcohol dehydrogenase family)
MPADPTMPLAGRVAIVTGGGRGVGRCHALALAAEGAAVVVNDLGGSVEGDGADAGPAQQVVAEIEALGGCAIASGHDIADWAGAEALVGQAVEAFGDLHVLVANAGILRDRTLANLDEAEWDDVIRVHLKGHAAPIRHAMAHWRGRAKAGEAVAGSVVCTTSIAGFAGNFGQAAYATAKAGILGLAKVVALEGARYGVRGNAVSPSARTRLETNLEASPEGVFDTFDPANVSPLVAWLARADCPATNQIFQAYGNKVKVLSLASIEHAVETEGRWTTDALDEALRDRLLTPPPLSYYVEEIG